MKTVWLQIFFLLLQVFIFVQSGTGGYAPSLNPFELEGVSLTAGAQQQLDLNLTSELGAGRFYRVGLWPGQYYDNYTSTVLFEGAAVLDPLFVLGASYGLVPVLLFSYYPNLGEGNGLGIPVGGYDKWFQIGQAYAQRYGPGGELAKNYSLGSSWQGPLFTAFNEADISFEAYGFQAWNYSLYYEAILGLAQGLHSVDPSIVFFPGGYAGPNRDGAYDLHGMGPLLAPLWNNGTLNGIDLHIYSSYANDLAFANSAQSSFDKVKQASGITADIDYFMTEYNFYYNYGTQTEQYGAEQLLTCMWDGWGVVKNDGHTSATVLTLVYDLYISLTATTTYGLDYSLLPWNGTARADTLLMTLSLTAGMQFTYLDPLVTGIFILEGQSNNLQKKMWVWQNRVGWSNITSTNFTFIADSLVGFDTLEIWGWDGVRDSLSISTLRLESGSYVLTNLTQGETYMFFATGPAPSSPAARPLSSAILFFSFLRELISWW